jgi:hypothetical protein
MSASSRGLTGIGRYALSDTRRNGRGAPRRLQRGQVCQGWFGISCVGGAAIRRAPGGIVGRINRVVPELSAHAILGAALFNSSISAFAATLAYTHKAELPRLRFVRQFRILRQNSLN